MGRNPGFFAESGKNLAIRMGHFEPGYIAECLEGSFEQLSREPIDLYMLHNPSVDNMAAEDTYALLMQAKRAAIAQTTVLHQPNTWPNHTFAPLNLLSGDSARMTLDTTSPDH